MFFSLSVSISICVRLCVCISLFLYLSCFFSFKTFKIIKHTHSHTGIAHYDCDVTVWWQCKQSHDHNDKTYENIKRKFEPKKKNTRSQVWPYYITIIIIRAHISEAFYYGFIDGNFLFYI